MSGSNSENQPSKPEPRLRHEFVGMMFAITIGEVGLQAAALVQAGHVADFLPAYSHLLLATVVVATSWVGWSLSAAPGARKDVHRVFQLEFLVLLLDVSLVITYFILVRTIDFEKELTPRIDPASKVAFWIMMIFALYLVWDFLTKVIISWRDRDKSKKKWLGHFDLSWFRLVGWRMLPTVVCGILAAIIWRLVQTADRSHHLTADAALLSLVLLFRAAKELPKKSAVVGTVVFGLGMVVGTLGLYM